MLTPHLTSGEYQSLFTQSRILYYSNLSLLAIQLLKQKVSIVIAYRLLTLPSLLQPVPSVYFRDGQTDSNKFYQLHFSQHHRVRLKSQFSPHSCQTRLISGSERIITRSVNKQHNKYLHTNLRISACTCTCKVVALPSSVESATSKKVIIMVHQ